MYKRILAPVDASDGSERVLTQAIALARAHGSELKFIHVLTGALSGCEPMRGQIPSSLLNSLRLTGVGLVRAATWTAESGGVRARYEVLNRIGEPAWEAIIEHADSWGADLIVVGAPAPGGSRSGRLDRDTEEILRVSSIPVLIAAGPEPQNLAEYKIF